jgi:hypothetical protein
MGHIDVLKIIVIGLVIAIIFGIYSELKSIRIVLELSNERPLSLSTNAIYGYNDEYKSWNRIRVDKDGNLIVKVKNGKE